MNDGQTAKACRGRREKRSRVFQIHPHLHMHQSQTRVLSRRLTEEAYCAFEELLGAAMYNLI